MSFSISDQSGGNANGKMLQQAREPYSLRETKGLPPRLWTIIIAAMIVEHDMATYKKRISDYLLEDVERGDTDR